LRSGHNIQDYFAADQVSNTASLLDFTGS